MPAYVISEVAIVDAEAARNYMALAEASIREYGGQYLARGANADVVEGAATERKIVLVVFPSMEQARAWYASPSYARALQFRDRALNRRLIFVDGVSLFAST